MVGGLVAEACAELGRRPVLAELRGVPLVFARGERLGAGPVLRLWRVLLLTLSRFWQIESLYRANAKYQPEWVPRFVCFAPPGRPATRERRGAARRGVPRRTGWVQRLTRDDQSSRSRSRSASGAPSTSPSRGVYRSASTRRRRRAGLGVRPPHARRNHSWPSTRSSQRSREPQQQRDRAHPGRRSPGWRARPARPSSPPDDGVRRPGGSARARRCRRSRTGPAGTSRDSPGIHRDQRRDPCASRARSTVASSTTGVPASCAARTPTRCTWTWSRVPVAAVLVVRSSARRPRSSRRIAASRCAGPAGSMPAKPPGLRRGGSDPESG